MYPAYPILDIRAPMSRLMEADNIPNIMMHLRPRQLLPLMLTNKSVYEKIKKNKEYYSRLAVYCVYREIHYEFPKIYHCMMNLPRGYHYAMQDFVSRVYILMRKKYRRPVSTHMEALAAWKLVSDVWGNHCFDYENIYARQGLDYTDVMAVINEGIGPRWYRLRDWWVFSNWLEDDNELSFEQKKAIVSSINNHFHETLHNHPLGDPTWTLYKWVQYMSTSANLTSIPWEKRKYICERFRDLVLDSMRMEIEIPSADPDDSYYAGDWIDTITGVLRSGLSMLYGNQFIASDDF